MFIGDYAGFLEKDDRHVNKAYLLLALFLLTGCSTGGHGSVMEKVKYDFGIGEAPEGYVSGTDQVYERLKSVGEMEMKRMNADTRLGEVKFREDGLHGTYFKEVKKYESAQALDAQPMSRGVNTDRGYYGYVEYRYQIYQSEHRATAAEAESLTASTPTGIEGRETYRYRFALGGVWDGQQGEKTNR